TTENESGSRNFSFPARSALGQTSVSIDAPRPDGSRCRSASAVRDARSPARPADRRPPSVSRRRTERAIQPLVSVPFPEVSRMKTRMAPRTAHWLPLALGAAIALPAAPAAEAERPAKTPAGDYQLSGPYAHDNLTIFLVHGKDKLTGAAPLVLQEA